MVSGAPSSNRTGGLPHTAKNRQIRGDHRNRINAKYAAQAHRREQSGKRRGHDESGNPLSAGADGKAARSDPVGEHLAEQQARMSA
jgi:hypothetical protein